ncbi:MAG: response regulator [Holophagaceae bacterium]|nr:response regulator [Holophagaceae bacterium]
MASRLLLVDNDRSFLKDHQVSLEAAFDIDVLSSPESAIAKLEGGGYAAVLISVEVAENKGYALCSAVRKSPKLGDLKVALISAKATEEEYKRHQSLKGKADLYLHKPISPTQLVEALGVLAPPRAVDPDNPLGDLSDLGAGDDWLDSLKSDLAEDLASPAPPPAAPTSAPAKTMAISADMLRELTGGVPMAKEPNPSATGPLPIPSRPSMGAGTGTGADPRVPELEAQIAALNGRIQEAQAQAASMEAHLKNMEQAVADRDSAIGDRDKALAERDGLLQERDRFIQERDAKLQDREAALAKVQMDFEALKSTHDSVTRNLDDLEKRQADAQVLQGRLEAAEAAVHQFEENAAKENPEGLKAQLREAMTERQELLQQVETLNAQLGEKTQRVVDLIKDRDKHQQVAMNLEGRMEEFEALKARHEALEAELAGTKEKVAGLEKTKGDLESVKTELLQGKADLQKALEDAKAEHASAAATLKAEHDEALQAKTVAADAAEEKAKSYKGEIAGLEATLKGQGRDLVEMGGRLADKDKEIEDLKATATAHAEQLAVKEAELAKALADAAAQADGLKALELERDGLKAEVAAKSVSLDNAQAELADGKAALADLEQQRGELSEKLSAHGEHVGAVHGLLDELEGLLAKRKALKKP